MDTSTEVREALLSKSAVEQVHVPQNAVHGDSHIVGGRSSDVNVTDRR